MKLNRGIRIALWVVPFVLFYAYIWQKGFEYPVVDDIMINQTILSQENMLLPYVGIGLSTLLVAVQKIFQGWNIYFIFLVLSYCGSISIFNDFLYKKKLYVLIPLTLLMQCVLIKYFSFSVISYLVAAAGILLLFNQSLVMGILTVAIGISIRPQIASSLIVLVLPFLLYEILKNKKWKEMLILIGIVFSIHVSNKVYSMTRSDVQEYLKWNELSTNLRDFPEINYEKHREEFEKLGISANDLQVSTYWLFAEKKALNNEVLEKIQSVRSITEKYSFDIPQFINDYFQNAILVAYLIVFAIWFIIFKPKNIWAWLLPLMPFILIGALFVRQRVVERVYLPLMVSFLMFFLIYAPEFYEKRQWFKKKVVFLCVQGILLIVGYKWLEFMNQEWYWFPTINDSMNVTYHQVVENHPNQLTIFGGYGTLVNSQPSLSTFRIRPNQVVSNTTTLGNWQTFSPHYTNLLKRNKIEDTDNLLSSAVNNDEVIFFWYKDSGSMNRIITIFKEHYQKTVSFEEVEKVDSEMSIFKLKAD